MLAVQSQPDPWSDLFAEIVLVDERGYIYFFPENSGEKVKIGFSTNPAKRLNSLLGAHDYYWHSAVPGLRSQEQGLHKYFRTQHIRRETFRVSGELEMWLERLRRAPFPAHSPEAVEDAYAPPGWLPWEEDWLPALRDQLVFPGVAEPNGRARKSFGADVPRSIQTLRSECDDWWTPPIYTGAARTVMGGIDLDPASTPRANLRVRAERIFTAADDGRLHPWHGKVWINPPYGGLQADFIRHLLREFQEGRVEQAVACLNAHAIETEWFAPLWDFPICFTHHRPDFRGPAGQGGSNTTGQAFVYLGPNTELFAETFSDFGNVVIGVVRAKLDRKGFRAAYPDPWLSELAA